MAKKGEAEAKDAGGLPEVEVMLRGLLAQPGVEGFLVFNQDGIPIKWTTTGFIPPGSLPNTNPIPPAITRHTALVHDLCGKAQASSRRILGAEGDLTLMRLHTSTKEYIIAPAEHETLLIVQKSHSAALELLTKMADAEQASALAAGAKKGDDAKKK